MIPQPSQPFLSVVATARNDDHGGNLLRRVQIFLTALAAQAKRHDLPIELILVDWNPPPEKVGLAEALHWPSHSEPFQARVITVPAPVHARYRFAQSLPLYQMIAKNVGIRRARGEFVLATNIDILLSDELMQFLSSRKLERNRMYRIDRHDVASDVPVDASIEEQLAYCQTHRIRVNAIDGTFPLAEDGVRRPLATDVVASDSGISFGAGWYAPEQYFGQVFRWANDLSVIHLTPSNVPRTLVLEIESGPGAAFGPFTIQLLDPSGTVLAESQVRTRRSQIRCRISPGAEGLHLHVQGGGRATVSDPRTLDFRVLRCHWKSVAPNAEMIDVIPAPARPLARTRRLLSSGFHLLRDLRRSGRNSVRIGLPVPRRLLDRLQLRQESAGISMAFGEAPPPASTRPCVKPALLHTNACGDFTLLHRDHWTELRGYPEFDLYSMNIDSLLCFMAHYNGAIEQVLAEPMRIYHIEHATGSGWTPEGAQMLFDRLAAKGIPWLEYEEVLQFASEMERLRTTMVFNKENWGLADFDLPDVTMPS